LVKAPGALVALYIPECDALCKKLLSCYLWAMFKSANIDFSQVGYARKARAYAESALAAEGNSREQ
jgi:hypothetical protein